MSRKNLFIIAGIVVVLIAAYFLAKKKKSESGFDEQDEKETFSDIFGEENPQCPEGQVWMDTLPGCVDKERESSYVRRGGRKVIPGTNIKYDYTLPKGTILTPEQRKFCIDRWGINWCIQIGGAGVTCKNGYYCCEYGGGTESQSGACTRCCPNVW